MLTCVGELTYSISRYSTYMQPTQELAIRSSWYIIANSYDNLIVRLQGIFIAAKNVGLFDSHVEISAMDCVVPPNVGLRFVDYRAAYFTANVFLRNITIMLTNYILIWSSMKDLCVVFFSTKMAKYVKSYAYSDHFRLLHYNICVRCTFYWKRTFLRNIRPVLTNDISICSSMKDLCVIQFSAKIAKYIKSYAHSNHFRLLHYNTRVWECVCVIAFVGI